MEKIRILLTDDSSEFLDVAENFLAMESGLTVIGRAKSGQEAIDMTAELHPDLVLMDVAMPGMSGLDATRRIKTLSDPPLVIILTLYDTAEYRAMAAEAGAEGFIPKDDFGIRVIPQIENIFLEKAGKARQEKPAMQNILITDDSSTMRRMIMASLRGIEEIRCFEAGSGLEAIERLAIDHIDLMTLDLNMPDMHGMEVLQFVRSHRSYDRIPIIVLSTKDDEATRSEAMARGATVYLTKPFAPPLLAEQVRSVLKNA